MASVTAADVKRLRDLTSAGMMECKKALEESNGDFDLAVEQLRITGAAKAAKRGAERTAANGLVAASGDALIELLCETDFVAKSEDFQGLAQSIAALASSTSAGTTDALLACTMPDSGRTVQEAIADMAGVIGEKIELGGVALLEGPTTTYLHHRASDLPPQVGVLVAYTGDEATARTIAMQIAAMRPLYVSRDQVPAETVANEERIAEATAREEGKPEAALPKIIEGRVNAYFKDTVLLEQPSVTDPKQTVAQVVDAASTTIRSFARFEPGQTSA